VRLRSLLVTAAAAAALAPLVAGPAGAAPRVTSPAPAAHSDRVCTKAPPGFAACDALVRTDVAPLAHAGPLVTPSGYGPADLKSAYKLPGGAAGSGRTVAIVDAFDDPTAEKDLAVYRAQYGLPPCTKANGCFKKVNQNGVQGSYPVVNAGWAQEISLDVDMVSATCPGCKILLVEATTNSFVNLGIAVNRAASLGAYAISNSYGGSDAPDSSLGAPYNHPGIAVTVSSGDAGYGVEFPASSKYVTAVGGTSLTKATNSRGWSEKAWSGAGSGCSAFNTALSAAATFGTGCSRRAVADVSAVADPNTGVAVYDSTPQGGRSGWLVFGGTSASAPIIASVYAIAGNTPGGTYANKLPYAHPSALFDVTAGSNGSCPTSQWCKARKGWDGPTGLGTPNGATAF